MRMRNLFIKICQRCKVEYQPTGSSQKFCKECSLVRTRERGRMSMMEHRRRTGKVKNTGVGKGGANTSQLEDSQYKNGIGYFIRIRRQIKDTVRFCERCGKDLQSAGRYEWCVHHINHDRTCNERSNLMLLCKRCHQIEHECYKALNV